MILLISDSPLCTRVLEAFTEQTGKIILPLLKRWTFSRAIQEKHLPEPVSRLVLGGSRANHRKAALAHLLQDAKTKDIPTETLNLLRLPALLQEMFPLDVPGPFIPKVPLQIAIGACLTPLGEYRPGVTLERLWEDLQGDYPNLTMVTLKEFICRIRCGSYIMRRDRDLRSSGVVFSYTAHYAPNGKITKVCRHSNAPSHPDSAHFI